MRSLFVLCDSSFSGRRLRAVSPECVDANTFTGNKAPVTATAIPKVSPEADTFFHELFHLVLGKQKTVPTNGEEYVPAKLLGKVVRPSSESLMTLNEALANPQTYTYVA